MSNKIRLIFSDREVELVLLGIKLHKSNKHNSHHRITILFVDIPVVRYFGDGVFGRTAA
jgi:hypothetical protein